MAKIFFIIGSIFGGISVATGAFGAHGLQNTIPAEALQTWETAARYQMYHALAIMGVALSIETWPTQKNQLSFAGWMFLGGVILFSGSLYVMSITGITQLGAITPFGGVLFVIGWLLLILAVIKR